MPEREVKQTLASYRDADGVMRYALAGEIIDVGADDLERFDRLNGTTPAPTSKAAPKKPAPQKR
jgi:hypothetical protein